VIFYALILNPERIEAAKQAVMTGKPFAFKAWSGTCFTTDKSVASRAFQKRSNVVGVRVDLPLEAMIIPESSINGAAILNKEMLIEIQPKDIAIRAEVEGDIDSIEGKKVEKILDFPESRQATTFTCGAAALQAVLYYYGIEKREDELREALGIEEGSEEGVDPPAIEKYLEGEKLKVVSGSITIADLRKYVDEKTPVICCIQAWADDYKTNDNPDYSGNDDGHYVVAIGYTDNAIVFDDPSIMSNRGYLLDEELDARWHDEQDDGTKNNHYGIAVIGDPTFKRRESLKIL